MKKRNHRRGDEREAEDREVLLHTLDLVVQVSPDQPPACLDQRHGRTLMFYVKLKNPLPGVRSEIFFFYNELEAEEFASCLHALFDDGRPFGRDAAGAPSGHLGCETVQGVAGDAREVFPHWSF